MEEQGRDEEALLGGQEEEPGCSRACIISEVL